MSALVGQANAYPEVSCHRRSRRELPCSPHVFLLTQFEEWLFANVFPEGLRILKEIRTSGKCVLQAAFKYAYLVSPSCEQLRRRLLTP